MRVEYTERGFEKIKFVDRTGYECSLQQSSVADFTLPGSSALWFGFEGEGERMHLSYSQVKELKTFIDNWLISGSFLLKEKSDD